MANFTRNVGIILILIGIVLLGYQGYTYTKHEKVAQIGDIAVVQDTQKTVYWSPWLGGSALAAGIILVIIARKGGAK